MHASTLLPLLSGAALVAANTPISGDTFKNDAASAAKAAAPLWHFDEKTCFPTDGTDGKGNMNGGLDPDHCNELKVNHNCPAQPKKNGHSTEANEFPTYYETVYCTADKSWRVVYDLYFPKDTGHKHDWEWAIVKWVDDGTGQDMWKRDGMLFEHEGDVPFTAWDSLQSTYNDGTDMGQDGQKGKDHAKLYVGKWHHSVWDTKYGQFANTCPPNAKSDYRSDDYYFEAAKKLVDGSAINKDWNYGDADSPPQTFLPDGKHDMCRYGGPTGKVRRRQHITM